MRRRTGIYKDRHGYRAVVNLKAGRAEKRYPFDADLAVIRTWRQEQAVELAKRKPATGTLAGDVAEYLSQCRLTSKDSQASNLKAWCALYGSVRRDRITVAMIEAAITGWSRPQGEERGGNGIKSAWTIRHRLQALRSLFGWLGQPFPAVSLERKPRGRPVFVSADLILAVAGRVDDVHTRARLLVLATTGVRPSELMRAQPADVDLERGLWAVRPSKGGKGRVLHLNPDMRAAWHAFISSNAWGAYDTTRYARRLRAAGWPKGIRPYAVRGTWAMDLSRRGVSLRVLQELLGHADITTTAVYYVAPDDSELASATRRSAGRFGAMLGFSVVSQPQVLTVQGLIQCGLWLRRPTLYPAELRARAFLQHIRLIATLGAG